MCKSLHTLPTLCLHPLAATAAVILLVSLMYKSSCADNMTCHFGTPLALPPLEVTYFRCKPAEAANPVIAIDWPQGQVGRDFWWRLAGGLLHRFSLVIFIIFISCCCSTPALTQEFRSTVTVRTPASRSQLTCQAFPT